MYNRNYGQRTLFLSLEREIEVKVSFINMDAALAMVIYYNQQRNLCEKTFSA